MENFAAQTFALFLSHQTSTGFDKIFLNEL
jgi:hypothetical protein